MIDGKPGANGASAPDDTPDHEEALAEMAAELDVARARAAALEYEVKNLKRQIRRMRRNLGYRLTHGISRVLTSTAHIFVRRELPHVVGNPNRFDRPSAGSSCSKEVRVLTQKLANQFKNVFYLGPSPRNAVLHPAFVTNRAYTVCYNQEQLFNEMTGGKLLNLPSNEPNLDGTPPVEFAKFELIIVDAEAHQGVWPLFTGRLWPHQKLLIHGAAAALHALIGTQTPSEAGSDFALFFAPPQSWLDPRHPSQPHGQPWKRRSPRLTPTAPSGRQWPRISIVTPTFNQGQFIEATLWSVLDQAYPNLEYLVLDGGSTDETLGILERFRKDLSYCCSEKDNGQAHAINKGFARATGDIFAWLNSDDQYAAHALARVAVAFDQFPEADIIVGGCGLLQDSNGSVSHVHHSKLPLGTVVPMPAEQLLDLENCWLKGDFFYQPEVFWRRRIWEAAGAAVKEDLYFSFDYDLWVRMARAGAKVLHIPDLLCLYRVHPAQKTYGAELPYVPELRALNIRLKQPSAADKVLATL